MNCFSFNTQLVTELYIFLNCVIIVALGCDAVAFVYRRFIRETFFLRNWYVPRDNGAIACSVQCIAAAKARSLLVGNRQTEKCFNVNHRGTPACTFPGGRKSMWEQSAPGIGIGIHLNLKHWRHICRLVFSIANVTIRDKFGSSHPTYFCSRSPGRRWYSSLFQTTTDRWQVNAPNLFSLRLICRHSLCRA